MSNEQITDVTHLSHRLNYLAAEAEEPLVFVLGSGMSLGAVPDVVDMTKRFMDHLAPGVQEHLKKRWATDNTVASKRYQEAALTVGSQRGDKALGVIIRNAVLEAYNGPKVEAGVLTPAQAKNLMTPGDWAIPTAQKEFARFVASVPQEFRRAIITTNFDPLIELALAEVGVATHPLPIPYDDPPSIDQISHDPNLPVMHIHGYFTDRWSQNSLRHIAGARPNLQEVLGAIVSGATVIVLGYGGWEDTFMKVLERHAAQRTILNAEVIWCAHSPNAASEMLNPTIQNLLRGPGFDLYRGIDAVGLFHEARAIPRVKDQANSPSGWSSLPLLGESTPVTKRKFAEGGAPTWAEAEVGVWPLFTNARAVLQGLMDSLNSGSSTLQAIIGPTGEGKSTALRQIASTIANEAEDVSVFWRGQGAAPIRDWLQSPNRAELGKVLLCIDEADLAADDLLLIAEASKSDPDLSALVACQDRLWWRVPAARGDLYEVHVFGGIEDSDAIALASVWSENDLLTGTRLAGKSPGSIATELVEASGAARGKRSSTLFGAILDVRDAEGLQDRVSDLMDKLYRTGIADSSAGAVTLGDIFAMICILEKYSPDRVVGGGASRMLISQAARAANSIESVAIMRALGREASVTFAGDFVYSRHPRIADAAVQWLRDTGRFEAACSFTARAGGRMKSDQAFDRKSYQDAYLLARSLEPGPAARAAAAAAINAAPRFMEPRITYLSVVRRFDGAQARKYAEKVADALSNALDTSTSVRVLLNELAIVDNMSKKHTSALGLLGLMLNNGTGSPITGDQLSYAFGSLAVTYGHLTYNGRMANEFTTGAELTVQLTRDLLGIETVHRFVTPHLHEIAGGKLGAAGSVNGRLDRLATELTGHARRAISARRLPFGSSPVGVRDLWVGRRLDFSDLLSFS